MKYEGALLGLSAGGSGWEFEGRGYDTPATEGDVREVTEEALGAPGEALVGDVGKLLFRHPQAQYTASVLLAMAAAYEAEVGDGEGSEPVAAVLREAARRVAVIEALTV